MKADATHMQTKNLKVIPLTLQDVHAMIEVRIRGSRRQRFAIGAARQRRQLRDRAHRTLHDLRRRRGAHVDERAQLALPVA